MMRGEIFGSPHGCSLSGRLASDDRPYVTRFPSIFRGIVPMGDVIDFGVPDFRPHGTRGTAATLPRDTAKHIRARGLALAP